MTSYLILDTETGGTDPTRHSLLDISVAAYVDGEVKGTRSWAVAQEEYIVTGMAMEINKIHLMHTYQYGKDKSTIMEELQHFIGEFFEEKPMILGHNPIFDRNFLKYQLFMPLGLNIDDTIHYRTLDTISLIQVARDLGLIPGAPTGLQKFAKYIGYNAEGAHTASGDVKTTIHVYEYLLKLLGGQHAKTI